MSRSHHKTSKFLSLVLRHEPGKIGLSLDEAGWASVDDLLAKMQSHGHRINRELLIEIVRSSDKQRFAFNDCKTHIRANQGHSIQVNLDYESAKPPPVLFHGTVGKFLEAIAEQGLCKMERHHVHLSADEITASKVGQRRGKPVILKINATKMHEDGYEFFLSANGVWLVEHVPIGYIGFPTPG